MSYINSVINVSSDQFEVMDLNISHTDGSSTPGSLVLSTTKVPDRATHSGFFSGNYIIISISALFIGVILIFILILLIRKICDRCRSKSKMLETYNSVTYDEDSTDDELDNCDDLVYTTCKLYVGNNLRVDSDVSNDEPEYDCISVDFSTIVNSNESSVVDWNRQGNIQEAAEQQAMSHNLKTTPHSFWRR